MNLTRLFEVQEILRGTWRELIRLKSEEDFLAYIEINNFKKDMDSRSTCEEPSFLC